MQRRKRPTRAYRNFANVSRQNYNLSTGSVTKDLTKITRVWVSSENLDNLASGDAGDGA